MTTYEKMQAKANEIEKAELEFNKMHREAKYYKKEVLQPLQVEYNQLAQKWKSELKNKT